MTAALGDSMLAKAVLCAVSVVMAIVFKVEPLQTEYEGISISVATNCPFW